MLEYRHHFGRFHPYQVPQHLAAHLQPVGDALTLLRELHQRRNTRPVADTLNDLLIATRAHVAFALRPGGEQALANVLHVADLARRYEADGGLSFRGFVSALGEAADRAEAPEAPILEDGSDGVRMMTVHKAKGLEFPVVVLVDPDVQVVARHRRSSPRRVARLCARCGWPGGRRPICSTTSRSRSSAIVTRAIVWPTSPRRARATCWWCPSSATRRSPTGG